MARCRTKSPILISSLIGWAIAAGLWSVPVEARAETKKVAVPKVKGPSKAGYTRFETGLRGALRELELTVIAPKVLAKAAKKSKKGPTTVAAAKAAGAHYLMVVSVRRGENENIAEGRFYDVKKGEQLAGANERWEGKDGAEQAGGKLGRTLVERSGIAEPPPEASPPVAAADEEEEEENGKAEGSRVVAAAEPPTLGLSAQVPKDEESPTASTTPGKAEMSITPGDREETEVSGEDAIFAVSLGGGSRVLNKYAVSVGGQPTGVKYPSSALALAQVGLRIGRPNTGFGADGSFEFIPSKYSLAKVDGPAVTPDTVNGRTLGIEGAGWYAFRLVRFGETNRGSFAIAPLAGASYDRFSVDRQETTEGALPVTLLLSSVTLSLQAGLRLGLRFGESFAMDLDGRYLRILKADEAPAKTGDPAGGNGFSAGLAARFWFTDMVGLGLQARYRQLALETTGPGNRTTDANGPVLENAKVSTTDAKASLAFLLAF